MNCFTAERWTNDICWNRQSLRSSRVCQALAQFSAESRLVHVTVAITVQQTRFAHEQALIEVSEDWQKKNRIEQL